MESPLDKEIYTTLPKDVYCQSDKSNKPAIVKLLRSLYGLKQAGELWYKTVKDILTDLTTLASSMTPASSLKETMTLGKL